MGPSQERKKEHLALFQKHKCLQCHTYDGQGAENADKCAWRFPSSSSQWPAFGGVTWKIQGNWSNTAYNAGAGYTDPSYGFQQGCLDTK